jgi:uncharacterized protein YndB with AHSA1/START domain
LSLSAGSRATVRITRRLPASPEDVFLAWIDPDRVRRWFGGLDGFITRLPELDPRPGGRFRIGIEAPDRQLIYAVGRYVEVDRPRRLVFTWGWEGLPMETGESLVTVDLFKAGTATDLVITHERNPTPEVASFHQFGWTMSIERMERLWRWQA